MVAGEAFDIRVAGGTWAGPRTCCPRRWTRLLANCALRPRLCRRSRRCMSRSLPLADGDGHAHRPQAVGADGGGGDRVSPSGWSADGCGHPTPRRRRHGAPTLAQVERSAPSPSRTVGGSRAGSMAMGVLWTILVDAGAGSSSFFFALRKFTRAGGPHPSAEAMIASTRAWPKLSDNAHDVRLLPSGRGSLHIQFKHGDCRRMEGR